MKITTISKVASLVISSVMIQTAVAGHEVGIGVGPHSSGGGIFKMLFGGGGLHSAPASGGDARFSFGGHPIFGRPVIVRPPSRITTSPGRLTIPSHQRDPISSVNHQSTANSRPKVASRKRLTSAFN